MNILGILLTTLGIGILAYIMYNIFKSNKWNGCGGDCNQGRRECNCKGKNEKL